MGNENFQSRYSRNPIPRLPCFPANVAVMGEVYKVGGCALAELRDPGQRLPTA